MIKLLRMFADFIGRLVISVFSGAATKKIGAPDKKSNSVTIRGNQKSQIKDIEIEIEKEREDVDISENSDTTVQKVHIKT